MTDSIEVKQIAKSGRLEILREDVKQARIAMKFLQKQNVCMEDESFKQNPEEILLEKCRKEVVDQLLQALPSILDIKEMWVLRKYVETNCNALKTSESLGCDEKNIRYYLGKIRKKAAKYLQKQGLEFNDFHEYLNRPVNLYFHQQATGTGLLYERYMELPKNFCWETKYQLKVYSKQVPKCAIPEYLAITESKSVCPICMEHFNCTRCDAFPSNRLDKKHEEKILQCIKNIQREMRCA